MKEKQSPLVIDLKRLSGVGVLSKTQTKGGRQTERRNAQRGDHAALDCAISIGKNHWLWGK